MAYIVICICFAIATGAIGRAKGSSFFLWFVIGGVLPLLEPERRCPRCGAIHKLYVQVCCKCCEDMFLQDPSEVRPGPDFRASQSG